MAKRAESEFPDEAGSSPSQPPFENEVLRHAVALLGGGKVLKGRIRTELDAHAVIMKGIPGEAVEHMMVQTKIAQGTLAKAAGFSRRTLQRLTEKPPKALSAEQGGRLWKFAEIFAKATEVFGDRAAALAWLQAPASGLQRHCPIDLLRTPAGATIVEQHLGRLEYGIYT